MKKIVMVLMIILVMTVLVGCDWLPFVPDTPAPIETLSADVEIINWIQDEGEVVATYEITNTGTVDIAYYKIEFEVKYADNSVYTIWHEKVGIAFADSEIVEVIIPVADIIARVDVVNVKLTEWKF